MLAPNYYTISGISIASLVICIFHLNQNYSFQKEAVKWFKYLAYLIICNIIADTMFYTFEGQSYVEPGVLYGIKFFEFSINPFIPYAVSKLFNVQYPERNNRQTTNRNRNIILWICVANTILLFADLFIHVVFRIDENNLYQRCPLLIIPILLLVASIVLSLKIVSDFSADMQNVSNRTIVSFCIVIGAGYAIRLIYPNTNFDWLGVVIAYFILLIYNYSLVLKTDPLTQLYNRGVYNHFIEHIDFPTIVTIIDANSFKYINDKYGHKRGDESLKAFADCILKIYGKSSYCFRIGGDEFCTITKPDSFKTLTSNIAEKDVYKVADSFVQRLNDYIKKLREENPEGPHIEYGLSIGWAVYYPPVYSPDYNDNKKHMSLDKVIQLADMHMYREKKAYKAAMKTKTSQNNGSH